MHTIRRKRVAGAYSMSSVLRYESNIQQCLNLLVNKLENHAWQGATINLSEWRSAFAYDVIGCLAYGAPVGPVGEWVGSHGCEEVAIYNIFLQRMHWSLSWAIVAVDEPLWAVSAGRFGKGSLHRVFAIDQREN